VDAKTHWEKVCATKAPEAVSWYLPHLETSLALIERAAAGCSASIIDVGGANLPLLMTSLHGATRSLGQRKKAFFKCPIRPSPRVFWMTPH